MPDSLPNTIKAANTELIANANADAVGDFFSPDYVAHVTEQDMTGGHRFVRRFLGMLQKAFPKIEVEVDILVESSDRVAWQRTLRGTQKGAFMGFPASGREMIWRDMVTSRFEKGLIAEEWVVSDLAERLMLARKG